MNKLFKIRTQLEKRYIYIETVVVCFGYILFLFLFYCCVRCKSGDSDSTETETKTETKLAAATCYNRICRVAKGDGGEGEVRGGEYVCKGDVRAELARALAALFTHSARDACRLRRLRR